MTMLNAGADGPATGTAAVCAAFGSDAGAGTGSLAGGNTPSEDGDMTVHAVTTAVPRLQQWPRQRRQRQQQQQQQQQQQPSNHLEPLNQTTAVACRVESLNDLPSPRAIGGYQPERISPSETSSDKDLCRSPGNSDRPPPPLPRAPSCARRGSGNSGNTHGSGNDRDNIDARSAARTQPPADLQGGRGCVELEEKATAAAVDVDANPAPGRRRNGEPGGGGGTLRGGRALRFPLNEERVAAVRCYLRDNDPIFVRKNLKRLLEGTLEQLAVGDTVTVARRYVGRLDPELWRCCCVFTAYGSLLRPVLERLPRRLERSLWLRKVRCVSCGIVC